MPKVGFTVPVGEWLREKRINKQFKELSYSTCSYLLKEKQLKKMWEYFDNKKGEYAYRLWILGCLGGWVDKHKIRF